MKNIGKKLRNLSAGIMATALTTLPILAQDNQNAPKEKYYKNTLEFSIGTLSWEDSWIKYAYGNMFMFKVNYLKKLNLI